MLRASFGGPPLNCRTELKDHSKLFLFCALFAANIVWSSYRAALTSALVTKDLKVPFTSLEGFLDSDYRFCYDCSNPIRFLFNSKFYRFVTKGGTLQEDEMRNAKEGSLYNRVFKVKCGRFRSLFVNSVKLILNLSQEHILGNEENALVYSQKELIDVLLSDE